MKVSREQIERLRDHAGVSYEDAQAALEASGGDQLDALVWLEQAGKIPSSRGPQLHLRRLVGAGARGDRRGSGCQP